MSLECSKCGAPMQYGGTPCRWFCPTCEAPCEACGKPGAGPCLTDDEDGLDQGLPVKILCLSCARKARGEPPQELTPLIVCTWRRLTVLMRGYDLRPRPAPSLISVNELGQILKDAGTYREPPRSNEELLREENEALRKKNRGASEYRALLDGHDDDPYRARAGSLFHGRSAMTNSRGTSPSAGSGRRR